MGVTGFAPAVLYYFIAKLILINKDLDDIESNKKPSKSFVKQDNLPKRENIKFCGNCGMQIFDDEYQCSNCGLELEGREQLKQKNDVKEEKDTKQEKLKIKQEK